MWGVYSAAPTARAAVLLSAIRQDLYSICPQRTVDLHLAVSHHLLDLTLLLEVLEALPGERAVDLEPVDERGDRHETVRLNILVELVGSGLVEDDGVLGLVLDYSDASRVSDCLCVQCIRNAPARKSAYPSPWTTSSSASSHQLPREPF